MPDKNACQLDILALEFAILVIVLGGQNEAILAKMDEISSFLTEMVTKILAEKNDFVVALLPEDEDEVSRLSTAYKTIKTAIKKTKGFEKILKKKIQFQCLFLKIVEEIVNEDK